MSLSFCNLFFIFFRIFCITKVFSFDKFQLVIFLWIIFLDSILKPWQVQNHYDALQYASRYFIVLHCNLWSVLSGCLHEVWSFVWVHFLPMIVQLLQHNLWERILSSFELLLHFFFVCLFFRNWGSYSQPHVGQAGAKPPPSHTLIKNQLSMSALICF